MSVEKCLVFSRISVHKEEKIVIEEQEIFKIDCQDPTLGFKTTMKIKKCFTISESNLDTKVPDKYVATDTPYTVETKIWVPNPILTVEKV